MKNKNKVGVYGKLIGNLDQIPVRTENKSIAVGFGRTECVRKLLAKNIPCKK